MSKQICSSICARYKSLLNERGCLNFLRNFSAFSGNFPIFAFSLFLHAIHGILAEKC